MIKLLVNEGDERGQQFPKLAELPSGRRQKSELAYIFMDALKVVPGGLRNFYFCRDGKRKSGGRRLRIAECRMLIGKEVESSLPIPQSEICNPQSAGAL